MLIKILEKIFCNKEEEQEEYYKGVEKGTVKKYHPTSTRQLQRIVGDGEVSLELVDTSKITCLSEVLGSSSFEGNSKLGLDCRGIETGDVSNVTDMSYMCVNAQVNDWNCLDFANWDTSNVRDMSFAFSYAGGDFNLANGNTSKVETMQGMFEHSRIIADLSKGDVSNVHDMSEMFVACDKISDISKGNVSNVENMSKMFKECAVKGDILENGDVSNVKDMSFMFEHAYPYMMSGSYLKIGNGNVKNVINMQGMFKDSLFEEAGYLNSGDVSNVRDFSKMFQNSKINTTLKGWKVSKNANIENMLKDSRMDSGDLV